MAVVQPALVLPSLAVTDDRNASHSIHPPETTLPGKDATTEIMGVKRTPFAGLFSTNRRPMDEKKLRKIAVNDETLTLDTNDLIDVRTKLGHCLVGYIAGKFSGLKAIGRYLNHGEQHFSNTQVGGWFSNLPPRRTCNVSWPVDRTLSLDGRSC
ncbi:UNVERIFIED_CONTAM: hypothetical protein Slati_2492700 [Sesamum latifolium]|uniref:Uncharacterized protein n=1 Tax=Sesamum latifolium TaxID=2727402 RepID=A0AAW2WE94_9LAMI